MPGQLSLPVVAKRLVGGNDGLDDAQLDSSLEAKLAFGVPLAQRVVGMELANERSDAR